MPFAQEKMGFSRPPKLFLRQDEQNAANPMGKTGFYDPENESVTLYITGRHPKDIMRSLAHELMHHTQKCNGEFDNVQSMGEQGYAQSDPHMRNMEIQAYQASIVFRDWEDSTKGTIYYEHLQKGDKSSMSTKDWKNEELKSLLAENWGFKMDLSKLNKEETHKKVLNEDNNQIFAPNHYCVHHGGVHHNGSIEMAEAVNHNYNEKLGRVTHYDMKLSDGTILENVAAEDIQVTNASLAEAHDSPGKRDDDAKPDYIDLDKDGDKEEPMKKAAKDRDAGRTGSGVDHGGDDDEEAKKETEGKADSKRELEEYASKRDGESKGDKGKDKEDPKDRDYSGHGMRKGDKSDTHKGEKDDTTKKGEKLKHSGKGRGEKKGDEAYINEDDMSPGAHKAAAKRDYPEPSLEEDGAKRKDDPRLRRPDADRLRENVVKLRKAGFSKTQIKEFLGNAYSKALKG